jgi:hypothetical protein
VTGLLHVGSPTVRQSIFGDWLVDDGSLALQHAADRRAAFAEAVARTTTPAVGLPKEIGGTASGCSSLPPEEHPDATKAFRGCEGAGAATAVEVADPALADHIENGAAA